MKKWRLNIISVLILAMALTCVTYASVNQMQKTLHYNNIKITLDGKDITPANSEPFIIDGSTYLPVRAVSEALGLDVQWDGDTHTVILSTEKKEETPEPGSITAEDILLGLRNRGIPVADILVYNEETDTNNLLGRPNNYIGKASFHDSRIETYGELTPENIEDYYNMGTIEVFSNKKDCDARYDYLESFNDPTNEILYLKQYIYKTDCAILRVRYDLTPGQAAEYETAFKQIVEGKTMEKSTVSGYIN